MRKGRLKTGWLRIASFWAIFFFLFFSKTAFALPLNPSVLKEMLKTANQCVLKYPIKHIDDFGNFLRTTSRWDDLLRIVYRINPFYKFDSILELGVARGRILATDVLELKRYVGKSDDAALAVLDAIRSGDDVKRVAFLMAKAPKTARFGTLGEKASSTVLRANMIASKIRLPEWPCAAHHIVAGDDPAAVASRAILRRFGLGVNGAANGVFLPTEAGHGVAVIHRGSHKAAYHAWVFDHLKNAKSADEVEEILRILKKKLQSGQVPPEIW